MPNFHEKRALSCFLLCSKLVFRENWIAFLDSASNLQSFGILLSLPRAIFKILEPFTVFMNISLLGVGVKHTFFGAIFKIKPTKVFLKPFSMNNNNPKKFFDFVNF